MSFIYLEVIQGKEQGKLYPIPDGAISIGRNMQNDIVLNTSEKAVSGHHAILYRTSQRIMVQDLRSTNGTFVNNVKISEKDLAVNDELGFGKTGPRLRLIASESELNEITPEGRDFSDRAGTADLQEESLSTSEIKTHSNLSDTPSLTMELEQKLLQKDISYSEIQKLIGNDKRLERVIRNSNLGENFDFLLRAIRQGNRSIKRKWLYAFLSLLLLSVVMLSVFTAKTFKYKQLLLQAQNIRNDLDSYETSFAKARSDPEVNSEKLKTMIVEMEGKQESLYALKTRIDKEDFADFYSDPLEERIDEIFSRFGESHYHIPADMLRQVRYHINIYSGRLNEIIGRYIDRRERYFPMIQKIFREKNIPVDLAYISMLESGFNPLAQSHAGARGIWQFIPQTARRFGLAVSENIDERTDPEKSTIAAAEYFRELIGIFGGKSSVMLCMAAYNAGEGKVLGALRKIEDPLHNRDFWFIYRMGYLTEETNEYIPRVIALMIISEYPDEYGFGRLSSQKERAGKKEYDFLEIKENKSRAECPDPTVREGKK